MENLVNLHFQNNSIRIKATEDGEVFFCIQDICKVLGFSNPNNAISDYIDRDYDLQPMEIIDSLGKAQKTNFVNESGLYSLIFNSELERAKEFKRWISSEVLPNIRRTDEYKSTRLMKPSLKELTEVAAFILEKAGITGSQLAISLDKLHRAKTGESALALTETTLIAKAQCHLYTVAQIGKEVGLSAGKVNLVLGAMELQRREDNQWKLTTKGKNKGGVYLDTNKRYSNGKPIHQTKWPLEVIEDIKAFIGDYD